MGRAGHLCEVSRRLVRWANCPFVSLNEDPFSGGPDLCGVMYWLSCAPHNARRELRLFVIGFVDKSASNKLTQRITALPKALHW